jgi:hypothetical protein
VNTPTEIPSDAIAYFDKTAFELVAIMHMSMHRKENSKGVSTDKPVASILERPVIELSDPIGDFVESQGHMIQVSKKDRIIGFSHTTGELFTKFVKNVHKTHQIRSKVSESFLRDLIFNWLVATKEKGQSQSSFSSHLLSAIEDSVLEYKIFYHVVYLLLNKPFAFANVEFGFFTKEYFKYFIDRHRKNNPGKDPKEYADFWQKFAGRSYAMVHVKAESGRAKEIAFQYCSRAIDVLKICSPTLLVPEFDCPFDIDKRLTRNTETEILVQNIKDHEVSVSMHAAAMPFSLTDAELVQFRERGLDTFARFLEDLESGRPSELQKMILIAIGRMAAAFTLKDLHQRIAEICSVLESLLLMNDTANMSDVVGRYFCRLVHSDANKKRELEKLYKNLYKIRSAWVHHAIRSELSLGELSYFQMCAQRLLQVLIFKTKNHTSKQTILAEIDEKLYNA